LKEFETLYKNIDLGILVAKNNVVDYTNDFFQNFISQVNNYDETSMLDLKVFKFFKNKTGASEAPNNNFSS
jgi:hypothetical protein